MKSLILLFWNSSCGILVRALSVDKLMSNIPQMRSSLYSARQSVAKQLLYPMRVVVGGAIAYFVAAKVGVATSMPPSGIVIIWPANAVLLVLLWRAPRHCWPLFAIATVAAEVMANYPGASLISLIGFGFVNFLEAALAVSLLRRSGRDASGFARLPDFLLFLIVAPLIAASSMALLGNCSLGSRSQTRATGAIGASSGSAML